MKKIINIFMLFLLTYSCYANADVKTGNDLYKWFKAYERIENGSSSMNDGYDAGSYLGFMIGIDVANNLFYCSPVDAQMGQFADIVGKYLKDNPQEREKPAITLAIMALNKVWPCNT